MECSTEMGGRVSQQKNKKENRICKDARRKQGNYSFSYISKITPSSLVGRWFPAVRKVKASRSKERGSPNFPHCHLLKQRSLSCLLTPQQTLPLLSSSLESTAVALVSSPKALKKNTVKQNIPTHSLPVTQHHFFATCTPLFLGCEKEPFQNFP